MVLEVVIRTAGPQDAAYLAELGARTFEKAFAAVNNPVDFAAYIAKAFSDETVLQELQDPMSVFLLAVAHDTNIGYAKIRKGKPPECVDGPKPVELERIYVDASKQSGGVGANLMQAVLARAKNEGYGTVWLGAWEKNPDAIRFYERQGFSAVGTKFFMVGGDRQNDIVMRRLLD